MNKKWLFASVGAAVTVIAGVGLSISISLAQTGGKSPNVEQYEKAQQDTIARQKATYPTVAYVETNSPDVSRLAKSRKYGLTPVLSPNIDADSRSAMIVDWVKGVSELPYGKSQLIVLGRVQSASAFISENRHSVYSEFGIAIERVFKNDTGHPFGVSDSVDAERFGGIVRYPSGFEQWVFVEGQGMPTVNGKYVFFLSYEQVGIRSQQNDLSILTAYEIRDDVVIPLDSPDGGTHPIATIFAQRKANDLFRELDKYAKGKFDPIRKREVTK